MSDFGDDPYTCDAAHVGAKREWSLVFLTITLAELQLGCWSAPHSLSIFQSAPNLKILNPAMLWFANVDLVE